MKKNTRDALIILGFSLLIVIGFFYFGGYFEFRLFAIDVPTAEQQLKQEYVTKWADNTDEPIVYFHSMQGVSYAEILEDFFYISSGSSLGDGSASMEIIPTFKGQEVVLLARANERGAYPQFKANGVEYPVPTNTLLTIKFIPHTFNIQIYDIEVNGVKVKEIDIGEGLSLSFRVTNRYAEAVVYFVGYKAQYECDLSSEEVWIRERFTSQFDINDLEFMPTKFCHSTRPFVLRQLDTGETAIRREEGIYPLNRGEIIPSRVLETNEIVIVNYATFYVEGVTNRCDVNSANVWDGNKWVCKSVIEPVQIIVQCETNEDCPQPLKEQCPDYFTGCINNFCEYDDTIWNSEICKNEVVTIIKIREEIQKQVLIESKGEYFFLFTQNRDRGNFMFGDEKFTASKLSYKCTKPSEEGYFNVPYGGNHCWGTTMNFMGSNYIMNNLNYALINPYITIQYVASGTLKQIGELVRHPTDVSLDYTRITESYIPDDKWSNVFAFSVSNGLKFDLMDENKYVLLNEDRKIRIKIINNLPRNTNAFVKIKQTVKKTNQILEDKKINVVLEKGEDILEIGGFDSSNLGIQRIELQMFYVINADKEFFIKSNVWVTDYSVVTEIPSIKPPIRLDCRDYGCSKGYTCKSVSDFNYVCTKESLLDKIIKFIKDFINRLFFGG